MKYLYCFFSILLTICLISCENISKDYTFIDDLDNTVKVNSAERIVALSGSFAEVVILSDLNLVGATSDAYTERNIELNDEIINVGSLKNPTLELIISCDPDFVILSAQISKHSEIEKNLSQIGITCAYFETEEFEGYLNMLNILTDISGNKEAYKQYGLQIKEEIDHLISLSVHKDKPKILLIRAFSTNAYAKDSNNMVGAMLKDFGCINIADSEDSLLEELSMEVIIKEDPDYIFVTTMGSEDAALEYLANGIQNHAAWKDLSAIKNGNYITLEKKLFHYKPNALWSESYEKLFDILFN